MTAPPSLSLNDGRTIPQLGLGVFKVAPGQAVPVIHEALKVGYRSIDTAALYGNEAEVGEAVRSSGLPRPELFVTTKLWNEHHGYDQARRAFDESLRRMKLDYVDLYLIHWPLPRRDAYVATWRALIALQAEGRTRSIGVSNFTIAHLRRVIGETGVVPAVNQVELHPWLAQKPLREFHREQGIATESWGPLARAAVLAEPALAALAARHGKTAAQIVLRWHMQGGIIAIPKSIQPARIRENYALFDFRLSPEDMAVIDGLDGGQRVGPEPDSVN